jgi:hypothetical protein
MCWSTRPPQGETALKDKTAMTMKGTLSYQACDDTLCFTPQTVPLTWMVTLPQLDRDCRDSPVNPNADSTAIALGNP